MNTRTPLAAFALASLLMVNPAEAGTKVPTQIWGQQLGTADEDFARTIAVDAKGNCHIAGATGGDLASKCAGKKDALIGKFDTDGKRLWLVQLGTAEDDGAKTIAIDPAGCVFVAGETKGKLGSTQAGKVDSFLVKLDPQGKQVWLQQFGTAANDVVQGMTLDAKGSVYITGSTTAKEDGTEMKKPDAVVRKSDAEGHCLWTRQWGMEGADLGNNIAIDSEGNILVCGATENDLGGQGNAGKLDVFVTKMDPAGKIIWSRQFGTPDFDLGSNLLIDRSGNIYVSGSSAGDLAGKQVGQGDAILLKLAADGSLLWKRQFGTAGWDGIHGVVFTSAGTVVVGGCQAWKMCEGFLREFDADGNELWQTKIATKEVLCGTQIGIDGAGNIYQVGGTQGPSFGPYAGKGNDIFLAKLSPEKVSVTP